MWRFSYQCCSIRFNKLFKSLLSCYEELYNFYLFFQALPYFELWSDIESCDQITLIRYFSKDILLWYYMHLDIKKDLNLLSFWIINQTNQQKPALLNSVRRKERGVESGINRSGILRDCGAGHSFVTKLRWNLVASVFPFLPSTTQSSAQN